VGDRDGGERGTFCFSSRRGRWESPHRQTGLCLLVLLSLAHVLTAFCTGVSSLGIADYCICIVRACLRMEGGAESEIAQFIGALTIVSKGNCRVRKAVRLLRSRVFCARGHVQARVIVMETGGRR
jgi:hypothetical protein